MYSTLTLAAEAPAPNPYAKQITASKRVSWDIASDVIRGRRFDLSHKFLPDGLTRIDDLRFLDAGQARALSQVQGRTYANMFGLVERFVGAKVLELTREHWLGDQVALEALVRFGEEELKHQELFRRIERLAAAVMPDGYSFPWNPNDVAGAVLAKPTWAVMCLTLYIELYTQTHFRESVAPDESLSPLFKDVFLYHWREEAQHAVLDELEWRRVDAGLSAAARDAGVDAFIELVFAIDDILQVQAAADANYFVEAFAPDLTAAQAASVAGSVLRAYRWQYILSGAEHPHFRAVLSELVSPQQAVRIGRALADIA